MSLRLTGPNRPDDTLPGRVPPTLRQSPEGVSATEPIAPGACGAGGPCPGGGCEGSASVAGGKRPEGLLAVADGQSHTAAAQLAGRRHGDTVARWVARFNGEGLAAVAPPWRGSSGPLWCGGTAADPDRAHAVSGPDAGRHGDLVAEHAATALRRAADGLPRVSTHTIGRSLHDAGFGW